MLLSILCLALTVMTCLTGPVSTQNQDDNSPNKFYPGVNGLPAIPGNPGAQVVADLPDVVGPPDVASPLGVPGSPESNGTSIKDDKSDTGDNRDPGGSRKSAFTAIKTSAQTGDIGEVLIFHVVPTNVNHDFNLGTNQFTCSIPGTYSFTYSIMAGADQDPVIELVQNGDVIVSTYMRAKSRGDYDFASNSAILNLEDGDHVWLQFGYQNGKAVHSNRRRYTSFSGFLLYKE